MEAYQDEKCDCHNLQKEINEKYPDSDWNIDEACVEWNERKKELKDNSIEFEDGTDECYACTCPTCGRYICGWCV